MMPMIESIHQLATRGLFDRPDLLDIRRGEGRWFLAEDMLSGLERGDREGLVLVIGCGDEDRLHHRIGYDRFGRSRRGDSPEVLSEGIVRPNNLAFAGSKDGVVADLTHFAETN
jgi:hypothetical protein